MFYGSGELWRQCKYMAKWLRWWTQDQKVKGSIPIAGYM